jgi:cobalamin biosynthesis protein CobD/CbiB
VAGALGIRLGGPIQYPEGLKEKPWLGSEEAGVGPETISATMKMLQSSAWVTVFMLLCPFFFI